MPAAVVKSCQESPRRSELTFHALPNSIWHQKPHFRLWSTFANPTKETKSSKESVRERSTCCVPTAFAS
jgi:hypothetical protein